MKKINYIIFLILINSILLTGCWNYKDVNTMRFLSGMAIDYDEESKEFIITVEIINPISEALDGEVFQTRGATVFDGIRDIIIENARKIYVAHAKVIIVSEKVAKDKMLSVIDYISRDAEYRDDIFLIVSKEKSAMEILETHKHEELEKAGADLHGVTSYFLDDVLKNVDSLSKYHKESLWKFIKDIYAEGVSPTLPIVKVDDNIIHKIPKLNGTAVFNKDKLIGWLNGDETKSYLSVIGELKGGLFTIESSLGRKPTEVVLELFNSKTKIKPLNKNDKITMKIDVENTVNIATICGTDDFISKKGREILKKDAEKYLKKQIEDTIKRVQREYHTDIFNFSTAIKKEMPDKWREIKNDWESEFSSLNIDVNVTVNIRGSAIISKPLKISK